MVFTGTGIVHRLFEIISPARASFIVFRMNESRLQRSLFLRPRCLAFYDRFLSRFDRLVGFNSLCVTIVCFSDFHPSRCLPSSAFLSRFTPLRVCRTIVRYSVSSEDSPHEDGHNLETLEELNCVRCNCVSANDIYHAVTSCDEPLASCQSVAHTSSSKKPSLVIIVRSLHAICSRLNLLCTAPFSLRPTKYRSKQ